MFNNWKLLCSGNLNEVNPSMAFPLMRWMSGKETNLEQCAKIDEIFFKVPPSIIISLLYTNCKGGFFKYPKAVKEVESDKEEIIRKYLKQIYGWSNFEYNKNKKTLMLLNINWGEFINQKIGLDKKEAKLLGVLYETKKQKFTGTNKPKSAGLDMFM